ncbi:hypothetical protein SYNPS1DRAFT_28438 [Syncephalis pseudoplumigaleata]|uniref:UBX domain-containing protein n=1 Tax=Syncephalis pseudoplumigaleata TaxID=1712513 RepID=A0A4P9Z2X6_9FUNG|nr:hypothetical protein SYNPS1DRAFT_28438 [Syncephalis pseudoplumigaleata]|eukprot:RKP25840.1 hypothetical protein SYNPS1DRAFT_28438 [Syncephalis pseudoplumigaleata]
MASKLRGLLKKEDAASRAAGTPPPGTYLQPVCMLMNREYATIAALQTTTFAAVGLTSGNAVMRVSFRASDRSLADVMSTLAASPQASSAAAAVAVEDASSERASIEPSSNEDKPSGQDNETATPTSMSTDMPSPVSSAVSSPVVTMIRVRFPDRVQLQLQFLSRETVGQMYEAIRPHLREPSRPFTLYITPPRKNLTDMDARLIDAQLAPASVVHFTWDRPEHADASYLADELTGLAEDLPELSTINAAEALIDSGAAAADSTASPPADQRALSTSSPAEGSQHRSGGSSSSSGGGGGDGSGSGSVKVPKWLKLSKCNEQ